MKIASSIVAVLALALRSATAIDVGDTIPSDLTLHHGFPPENISLDDRLSGKNVLIVGLPGAFTPT
jgi:peroxiredoxin